MNAPITDLPQFAIDLAAFLVALQQCDATGGPSWGPHNFHRGGPLTTYDGEARQSIAALDGRIDTDAATEVWEAALAASWHDMPVWFHGDIAVGNLLVQDGQLSAVIDFGTSGVGDPSWARGRGWTLWKALIAYAGLAGTNPLEADKSRHIINEVLADHILNSQGRR